MIPTIVVSLALLLATSATLAGHHMPDDMPHKPSQVLPDEPVEHVGAEDDDDTAAFLAALHTAPPAEAGFGRAGDRAPRVLGPGHPGDAGGTGPAVPDHTHRRVPGPGRAA